MFLCRSSTIALTLVLSAEPNQGDILFLSIHSMVPAKARAMIGAPISVSIQQMQPLYFDSRTVCECFSAMGIGIDTFERHFIAPRKMHMALND
jgi:hypothetical protein